MKIPKDTAERIITGSMQDIWNTFVNLDGEYKDFDKDYELARFGIKVKFEIYDLWETTNKILRKDKDGKVIISKNTYNIEDFRTEKEERRKIMVNAILENIDEKEVTTPR